VMIAQQLQDQIDRCIKSAETDYTGEMILPASDSRANKFLAFDADGNPVASAGGIDDAIPVSAFGETLIDDANAAAARTTLGMSFSNYGLTFIGATDAADARGELGFGADAGIVETGDITSGIALNGQVATADGAGAITWTTPIATAPNSLLNGAFDFWQRGTTTTIATGAGAYLADRWYAAQTLGTNAVVTYERVTGSNDGAKYGLKLSVTTAATAAFGTTFYLAQTLENRDSLAFYGQDASMSFLVKAVGNVSQVGIQFYYAATEIKADTAIGSEELFTVNSSSFTPIKIDGQAMGVSMTAAGVVGVRLRVSAVSTGNLYDLGNGIIVENAMMNVGATAGTFKRAGRTAGDEIYMLQRFYEKSYDLDVVPGTVTVYGCVGQRCTDTNSIFSVAFQTRKRTRAAVPTVTFYNPETGATGTWRDTTAGANRTVTENSSSGGTTGTYVNVASTVVNNVLRGHFTVDAEI
jgi:hypothetical protein